jgi:hypothetical protein
MDKNELKYLCENDLYFLTKNILGYSDLEEEPHVEVCQFLEGKSKKKLLLLPRDTFKTTISTISRAIQEIIRNPNVRILFFSETFSQSKAFLSEVKQHLETNEKLIGLYGQFVKNPGWKEEAITVKQRTGRYKEATIMCGGVDVVRTGFHYNYIIIDDPHSQKNVSTREQIEKVKTAVKLLSPMLLPDGEITITATRWHDSDLSSDLLEDNRWTKMVRAAEWVNDDGTKSYFFPKRLSPEFLKDKRETLGGYLYSCNYLNNPVDDENADFKRSWFKTYREENLRSLVLKTYITIDPAVGQKDTADFIGIIVNSVDILNNWFFRKMEKIRIDPLELIDKIFEMNRTWHPVKIGIEKEKYTQVLKPFLDQEMKLRNEFPPVEEMTLKISNKEMRIRGLAPRYERGCIFHNEQDNGRFDLEDELLRFPFSKYDDVSDAAGMQSQLTFVPGANIQPDYVQKSRGDKMKFK